MSARTTDLGLAAALLTLGRLLESIDNTQPSNAFCFVMEQNDLDVLHRQYLDHHVVVDAFRHAQELKMLKRLLRNATQPVSL